MRNCRQLLLPSSQCQAHVKSTNFLPLPKGPGRTRNTQGGILAVWILAPKLPKSDLKIAVDFWVDFFLLFFPRKKARKNPPKIHGKIHPGTRSEKFPSDFCRSLLLRNTMRTKLTTRSEFTTHSDSAIVTTSVQMPFSLVLQTFSPWDPDVAMSRTKTLCTWSFSVVLNRDGQDVPGFGSGRPRFGKTLYASQRRA